MHNTEKQWEQLFKEFESDPLEWEWGERCKKRVRSHKSASTAKVLIHRKEIYKIRQAKYRFLVNYKNEK